MRTCPFTALVFELLFEPLLQLGSNCKMSCTQVVLLESHNFGFVLDQTFGPSDLSSNHDRNHVFHTFHALAFVFRINRMGFHIEQITYISVEFACVSPRSMSHYELVSFLFPVLPYF